VSSARGRGGAGSFRGNSRNGSFNNGVNSNSEQHGESLGQTRNGQDPREDFSSRSYNQKRSYCAAFSKPATSLPRPQAAPAVPSFGADILPHLNLQPDAPTVPKKKLRKHNQLGLTPASQDHESSSDEDEEARLASGTAPVTASNPALLQFEYKGRTATLNTAADIAAWIAERKRRFPTAAKAEAARKEAEEKKSKWEENRKERAESQRLQRQEMEKTRQEELRKRALESVAAKQSKKGGDKLSISKPEMQPDDFVKAALKEEKLKRKLEKAQRDARKAEEALARMQQGPDSVKPRGLESAASLHRVSKPSGTSNLVTQTAETAEQKPNEQLSAELSKLKTEPLKDPDDEDALPVSDLSSISSGTSLSDAEPNDSETDEAEAVTSSSGSSSISSSDSASEAEVNFASYLHSVPASDANPNADPNADLGPEELTSKRTAPDRVSPPPRIYPSKNSAQTSILADADHPASRIPCRNLLRTGRCHFGERCRYRHDLPKRGGHQRDEMRKERKGREGHGGKRSAGRKGLYQVMVEKEVEEERREALRATGKTGERGMLKETDAENGGIGQQEER
jgi:Nuclear fragile X mental retardation-interacting protein 1 (NUFIP1)/Zinc finger C-x8-C-x5-C-x3-H type (and similar)